MTKIVDPGFQITKVAEDQFGEKWVKVTKDDDSVWISIGRFSESDAYGFKCLGKIGVTPLTPGTKSAAKRYLEEGLEDTEDEIHVALQPGYVFVQKNDAQRVIAYVHASGHTYPVEDADAPDIILGFDPDPSFQTQGNHIAFQEGLGPLVKDQALPILMLTLALAPILQPFIPSELYVENAIVEVCGDGTSGKSAMAIGIAGAVWGGNSTRKTGFFQSWNQTVNKIEQSLGVYNNAMAGFDEATAVSGNKKQRAEAIGNLVHRISLGSGKGRMGEENSPDFRLIAISTSNQPLAQICGEDAQVLQAIETRLITLEVPKRDSKVFDYVPKGFDSAQKATQQFYVIGLQHYGHTAKLLIERTLAMFVKDPHAFQKRAGEMMSHFMKEAGQDKLDLRALRRLKVFALAYAAGKLAYKLNVLDKEHFGSFKEPLLRAWDMAQGNARQDKRDPYFSYLRKYAAKVKVIESDDRPEMDDDQFQSARAFVWQARDGQWLVGFPPRSMAKRFPGFEASFQRMREADLIVADKTLLQSKQRIRMKDGEVVKDRLYVIRIDHWPLP